MPINSRAKGASAEREFASEVYNWTGIRLVRNLEQSRSGGFDLVVAPDEVGAVSDAFRSLAIECKRYGKVTPGLIAAWWQQARLQAEPYGLQPILAYRGDRAAWRIVTPLSLINPDMTRNLSLDCTATLSIVGFCSVIGQ